MKHRYKAKYIRPLMIGDSVLSTDTWLESITVQVGLISLTDSNELSSK